MTSKNKKFENLKVYLARPMEDDNIAHLHEARFINALVEAGMNEKNLYGPCKYEEEKTGFNTQDSNRNIGGWRLAGLNDKVDDAYVAIWKEDIWQLLTADIVIAHIRPGLRFTGTALEGAYADVTNFIDPIRDRLSEDLQKRYTDHVRPWLKEAGFCKPVYLVTSTKTEINGTYVHKIVRGSGGDVFPSIQKCIEKLKEDYK